ncbi:MAG TPA: peptidoglycan DD-metalloendopeptidase family protein [Flavobacterium sp.]|nr:peptidoglycan DD-metalloendopeptidase family protein [Flavobacterium sp.]
MKRLLIILFVLIAFISCNKKTEEPVQKPLVKAEPIKVEFGFTLNNFDVVHDTIKSGDTFGSILESQNIGDLKVHEVVEKIKDTFNIRKIRIGKPYTILRSKDAAKKVQVFIYQPDKISYYVVDFRDSVTASKKTRPITIKRRTIAGELDGSLSVALEEQRIDPSMATRISHIYKWSIDFFKLQKGDKFALTFTERFINDSVYDGVEDIEAALFEYKGKMIYAFPFAQDTVSGKIDYYDEEGKVLKNMFLKAPLKFSRISSKFSRNRFHPVQQVWKAHKGTDYAASHGTPIMTTAAGVVEQTGFTAGNGNFVKVKHNSTYSTQYLHMSKILVRRGQRVAQGDVIGKVGSTGLATGPHVCYRFWKNGVQVDALRLKLPNSEPMNSKHKSRYIAYMTPLKAEIDSVANLKFSK